jgi:pyruvate,water dikinase
MRLPFLGEPACNAPLRVGRKAATLSRLSEVTRVPPGFCVPADFAAAELSDAIATAYAALSVACGAREALAAVRSSAVEEDGANASFAGLFETILNVVGAGPIIQAILRCRASAATSAVRRYRTDRGLAEASGPIPVLVQRLVIAESSAVAFSVHPVTGARDQVVVNANWGLGESIVGGRATPDSFVVCKRTLRIIERGIGSKLRMTTPAARGATDAPVPVSRQRIPSLDDGRVMSLAKLTLALEAHCGHAVDVEAAFSDGDLWLLQCRPVTTAAARLPG